MSEGSLISQRFGIHQARIGRDFVIHFYGSSLQKFLGIDADINTAKSSDVLPEIVGIERIINTIIDGGSRETSIKRINRIVDGPLPAEVFFDLFIINDDRGDDTAALVIRDVTGETLIRQSLQQRRNEIHLLQQDLSEKNIQLMKSQKELRELNKGLEKAVDNRTRELKESIEFSRRLFSQTVNSLMSALEKRDPYTAGHQQRVALLAEAIGRELGLSEHAIEGISVASRLHDIGKIYVPSEFLTKPLGLSEAEFTVIKTHSSVGFDILRDIEFPWPVATIILQHHEKCDGSGYPFGLKGEEILLESKIVTVADVVEAMATYRPYRFSSSIESALEEIEMNSGILYGENVVKTCISLFRKKGFKWNA